MEIRKFRNYYGLELITASHAGIHVGDLVWDPLIGSPGFSHPGMPNSIYTAFLDANLIDKKEFELFRDDCKKTKLLPAHLTDRTVEMDSEFITEIQHPLLGKIEGSFTLDSISKFHFGELQVRELADLLRVKVDQYLEIMKANNWKEYDGRIRRVSMITELYYGSMKLIVERSLSGNLDAVMKKNGITAVTRNADSKSVAYSFSHEEVPFAMRIERVRNFNG
ncbi:MAG: hypothetical protein WD052_06660 [Bacteroidales bacterium]